MAVRPIPKIDVRKAQAAREVRLEKLRKRKRISARTLTPETDELTQMFRKELEGPLSF